jgi:hypothetical protein
MTSTRGTAIQTFRNGAHRQLTFGDILIAKTFLYFYQSRDKDISPKSNVSSFLSSATQINEQNFGLGIEVSMKHSHSDPKLCGRSVGPYPLVKQQLWRAHT